MQVKAVKKHIVSWLNEYISESGTKGFVVGVSGGIDSAVTSTLGALTGKPMLCVEMPIHQSQEQVKRANDHIDWLQSIYPNVARHQINLTEVFDEFVSKVAVNKGPSHELGLVNTRARLRMTALYYYAGLNNYLVLGTGNKVEDFGIGFYTKYGDGGVDLSPIADLMKSEVYELGSELGIIGSIIQAAPTDGLWGDDRTDEDAIGASYSELEWAMEFDENKSDASSLTKRQKEVLNIYRHRNKVNQHKMLPIPVCPIPIELKVKS